MPVIKRTNARALDFASQCLTLHRGNDRVQKTLVAKLPMVDLVALTSKDPSLVETFLQVLVGDNEGAADTAATLNVPIVEDDFFSSITFEPPPLPKRPARQTRCGEQDVSMLQVTREGKCTWCSGIPRSQEMTAVCLGRRAVAHLCRACAEFCLCYRCKSETFEGTLLIDPEKTGRRYSLKIITSDKRMLENVPFRDVSILVDCNWVNASTHMATRTM